MAELWRLINLEYDDPYMNMAVEETIPRMVGTGKVASTVRFWRNRNAAVLGRFQPVRAAVNLKGCAQHSVAVVRRHTGGGSVYQDLGNLNYAISAPDGHPLVEDDIHKSLRNFSMGVIAGLAKLGVDAQFDPEVGIKTGGGKIGGLAASSKWRAFFLHGTVLVNTDVGFFPTVLRIGSGDDVTTVEKMLDREVSMLEVREKLKLGFEEELKVNLKEASLTSNEIEEAARLRAEKYATDEWNYQR